MLKQFIKPEKVIIPIKIYPMQGKKVVIIMIYVLVDLFMVMCLKNNTKSFTDNFTLQLAGSP